MRDPLEEAYAEFWEELLRDADASGDPQHSCFFRIFSELAAENGDSPDLMYTPARREGSRGYQIDGYSIDPERGELYLAVCDFRSDAELGSLVKDRIDSLFGRAERFFLSAIGADFVNGLEETSPAFEAAYPIYENQSAIKRVRIIIFSNARFASRKKAVDAKETGGFTFTHNILDFSRYVDVISSRTGSEPIELEIGELSEEPVLCIRAHTGGSRYESYLAAIPGELLAKVYGLYGARLLEQNVRTFLQARTKVNKGIIETIASAPEMFFAYNNGLTATAAGIDTELLADGSTSIRAIRNLQIVNGGQTTASILYAKDKSQADLKHVYVQMKLSVVPPDQLQDVVPKISRYANTQNRISEADFFSGHPYHLALEKISRNLSAPQRSGAFSSTKWFYERARGQYKDKQAYLTPGQKNRFLAEYPKDQVITKTDLAKAEISFEARPHLVSRGAQKCFMTFAEEIGEFWEEDSDQFGDDYFKEVVARSIVFRWTDAMIGRSAWYREDRGYKANILTYTIAWLVNALKAERRATLDFGGIWNEQEPPDDLKEVLSALAPEIASLIKNAPPDVKNISEYCKRDACWAAVQKSHPIDRYLLDGLGAVSNASRASRSTNRRGSAGARRNTDEVRAKIGDPTKLERFARNRGLLTKKAESALKKLADPESILLTGERSALSHLLSQTDQDGFGSTQLSTGDEAAKAVSENEHRNWTAIVERLNQGVVAESRIQMGSPGSAQVTAVRLRKQWENLVVRTEEAVLILSLE